jgi:nitroimidazol reductase NimA-like FMN-containing flavoprotein (pyridoxamine 5'-phosphate oxidase superfamily)
MKTPKKPVKKDAAPLNERQRRIHDFLSGNRTGVLAMVDPDGEPHGVVVYYAVGDKFAISFLTKTHTKKYDNLIRNSHVMLVVFEPSGQKVAQITGKATEIKDNYEVNAVAADIFKTSLNTSESGMPPLVKLDAGAYTAFRITPGQIRMATFANPDSGDYENVFESIESFNLKEDWRR